MNDIDEFGIKISLKDPESFLLVKETLTRIGVASNRTKTLYQSAHILHKRGEYYIVHFKTMFALDGKRTDISDDDYGRRNLIAKLLQDWGLVTILAPIDVDKISPMSSIKVISFKDKGHWSLVPKYTIGGRD